MVALAFNHNAQKIEVSLVYKLSSRLTKAISRDSVSKTKPKTPNGSS